MGQSGPDTHKLLSRLNQVVTGHCYSGEYYQRMNIPTTEVSYHCMCANPPLLHLTNHIIRECPLYEESRNQLQRTYPHLTNPRFKFRSLFMRERTPHLLWWLKKSGAFTKRQIPWEEIPSNPHDPGPNTVVLESYSPPPSGPT